MLPDEVLDAGAAPERWANRRPGYCYLVAPGLPEDRYADPGRTRWFTQESVSLMETVAQWFARNGATVDPVTEKAAETVAGRAYTDRRRVDVDAADLEDDDMIDENEPLVDADDEHIDPEQELPEVGGDGDVPLVQETGYKPDPAEARQLFAQAIAEFEANKQMVIGPKDFTDWCDRNGYSRPWVSERLKEAYLEGRLADAGRGRWRIIPQMSNA
ncbi:hypothetical protein [Streptomyces sp. DHE17-7]|uniref:hypothetical protein n=1 Tax=Streptomyces sp. DHE17-7 TaxID=2759949 RepID=UPI003FA792ED